MSTRTSVDGVTYKIASCRKEREDAFRLVHDVYCRSGLMEPNEAKMRITPFHLLPTTDLFVAYHGKELIYTMTLIGDDQMGMPLEDVYGAEIEMRRPVGSGYFAEVSCLASRRGYFSRSGMFDVFVRLAALVVQSARENGIDRLLIACHPRHANFYQNFLGFTQIGEERNYARVCDRPAVACEHEFSKLDVQGFKLQRRIYAPEFRKLELYHQPMLQEDQKYFTDTTDLHRIHFPLGAVH